MLQKMAARFSRLIELDFFSDYFKVFYPGVIDSDIADGFRCLKVLNLQHCKGISDKGMMSIGGGLSSLQSLNLSYCKKLMDKGLSAVAEGCQDLQIVIDPAS